MEYGELPAAGWASHAAPTAMQRSLALRCLLFERTMPAGRPPAQRLGTLIPPIWLCSKPSHVAFWPIKAKSRTIAQEIPSHGATC